MTAPDKPYRWTRARYKRAHHLIRLLRRVAYCQSEPALVKRYIELWEQHPYWGDPLAIPLMFRYENDIPF